MKIRKGIITAVFIVLLAMLAIFPAQSEATPYSLVQVMDGDTVLVNGTPYTYAGFEATINIPGNTIGTLSFYNGTLYSFTTHVDSIASLTVEAGANVDLLNSLGSANVTVNGGTVIGDVDTIGTVTVNGGSIEAAVLNPSLVNATNVSEINSAGNAVVGTSGNVNITDSSVTAAGGVGIHSTGGSVTATGSVISADQDAILYTDSNVTVIDSELTAGLDGITETGGSVTVTGSTIEADSDAIYGTDHNVTVTDSWLFALENGIVNTGGSVNVTDSGIFAMGHGIYDTGGNVTVTGASSIIYGDMGGIYYTDGYVQIGTGVIVDGGTGAAINGTGGSVVVGSALGGATISGAEGIIDTGGDLTVIKSDITATDGDGIRGVSGYVDISDSTVTALSGDAINVDGASSVEIDTVIVDSGYDGIIATNTGPGGVTIRDTSVTAGGVGIDASGSAGVVEITDTSVYADGDGIVLSNTSVYGNVINNLDITRAETDCRQ